MSKLDNTSSQDPKDQQPKNRNAYLTGSWRKRLQDEVANRNPYSGVKRLSASSGISKTLDNRKSKKRRNKSTGKNHGKSNSRIIIKTVSFDQTSAQEHANRRKYYESVKARIQESYESISTNTPKLSGLSPKDLALGCSFPASTIEERRRSVEIIKTLANTLAIKELVNIHEQHAYDSKWRDNAAESLAYLGLVEYRNNNIRGRLSWSVLSWRQLPVGWWNDPRYTSGLSNDFEQAKVIIERVQFIDSLSPFESWEGSNEFGSGIYYVFIFDRYVVAECPLQGNALYVIKGTQDWRNLLRRSKSSLTKNFPERTIRIIHSGDWKARLKKCIS